MLRCVVRQRFYHRFAQWMANRGVPTLTFANRGTDASGGDHARALGSVGFYAVDRVLGGDTLLGWLCMRI